MRIVNKDAEHAKSLHNQLKTINNQLINYKYKWACCL